MSNLQKYRTFDSKNKPTISVTSSSLSDEICKEMIEHLVNGIKNSTLDGMTTKIDIRQELIEFDRDINNTPTSKFQDWVINSDGKISSFLINQWIEFHVYHDHLENNLIAVMGLAIGMFDICFIKDRSSTLRIIASLDNGKRMISRSKDCRESLAEKSAGYTVSGVTYPSQHLIFLTKKQEIIKLLFHEMIHYAGLDKFMPRHQCSVLGSLDFRESYSEAGSVILNSAFISIMCSSNFSQAIQEFKSIISIEQIYSRRLSTQILEYHGYSCTEMNSFPLPDKDHQCPIAIWEYVLYRTKLLSFPDILIKNIMNPNDFDSRSRIEKICIDNNLFKKLSKDYLPSNDHMMDISYIYHDIDWNTL
jgi:hypothetical protein